MDGAESHIYGVKRVDPQGNLAISPATGPLGPVFTRFIPPGGYSIAAIISCSSAYTRGLVYREKVWYRKSSTDCENTPTHTNPVA